MAVPRLADNQTVPTLMSSPAAVHAEARMMTNSANTVDSSRHDKENDGPRGGIATKKTEESDKAFSFHEKQEMRDIAIFGIHAGKRKKETQVEEGKPPPTTTTDHTGDASFKRQRTENGLLPRNNFLPRASPLKQVHWSTSNVNLLAIAGRPGQELSNSGNYRQPGTSVLNAASHNTTPPFQTFQQKGAAALIVTETILTMNPTQVNPVKNTRENAHCLHADDKKEGQAVLAALLDTTFWSDSRIKNMGIRCLMTSKDSLLMKKAFPGPDRLPLDGTILLQEIILRAPKALTESETIRRIIVSCPPFRELLSKIWPKWESLVVELLDSAPIVWDGVPLRTKEFYFERSFQRHWVVYTPTVSLSLKHLFHQITAAAMVSIYCTGDWIVYLSWEALPTVIDELSKDAAFSSAMTANRSKYKARTAPRQQERDTTVPGPVEVIDLTQDDDD